MNRPNGHISRESFDALYADYKPRFVRIAQSYVRNVKAAIQRALGIMREALKDCLPAWLISLLLSEMRF